MKKIIWLTLFATACAVMCLVNFIAAINLGYDTTVEGKRIITMWGYALLTTIGVSTVISLYCLFKLWKGHDKIIAKFIWSVILLLPFLGPIFYGGFHNPPPSQADDLKAPFTDESYWQDTNAHEHVGHGDSHDLD